MIKINKSLTILISISLLYLIISISYSYFAPLMFGVEEGTTISLDSGIMRVNYASGTPNITAENIKPSVVPFAVKEFTVTGVNTYSDNSLIYHLFLEITTNTFSHNTLEYTLEATGSSGTLVPSNSRTGLNTGSQSLLLGVGSFQGGSSDVVHSYILNVYFYETGNDQSYDMGKEFAAHVVVSGLPYNMFLGVNEPQIRTGMTPIKFDGLTEVVTTTSDPDWYSYEYKKWANAKTDDGSYWVWIPRYAYKIKSCYALITSECLTETDKRAGEIEIAFLEGATDLTFGDRRVDVTPMYAGHSQTNFIKHPAFVLGTEEIEGFWVAKFQMSEIDSKQQSLPNLASKVNEMDVHFNNFYNMKDNQVYGWNSLEVDTHMLKNSEWGAMAYLARSVYGADADIYVNNSGDYITGCAGDTDSADEITGCANAWNTSGGVKASSTHNITGVYDMAGPRYNVVAAYYSGSTHSSLTTYGQVLIDSYGNNGNKYVDVYPIPNGEYIGHALFESPGWAYTTSVNVADNRPFQSRGGRAGLPSAAGVFAYYNNTSSKFANYGSRAVVVSK